MAASSLKSGPKDRLTGSASAGAAALSGSRKRFLAMLLPFASPQSGTKRQVRYPAALGTAVMGGVKPLQAAPILRRKDAGFAQRRHDADRSGRKLHGPSASMRAVYRTNIAKCRGDNAMLSRICRLQVILLRPRAIFLLSAAARHIYVARTMPVIRAT